MPTNPSDSGAESSAPRKKSLKDWASVAFGTIFFLAFIVFVPWAVIDWLFFSESEPSEPEFYACSYEAKQAIKRRLAFPSTFDEHGLITSSKGQDLSIITRVGNQGWDIRTVMVFGSKNAFGVRSDYLVWYDGRVDEDGNCTGVVLDQFVPFIQ